MFLMVVMNIITAKRKGKMMKSKVLDLLNNSMRNPATPFLTIGFLLKDKKILNKNLHYKLLFHPDLYFGEAYTDGQIIIENGTLTDFLDLALKNFVRGNLNFFSYLIK